MSSVSSIAASRISRQAQIDLEVAEGEYEEAQAAVRQAVEGEGALTVEEGKTRAQLAQKKVERLREEFDAMKPLMEKGFITRDELARTSESARAGRGGVQPRQEADGRAGRVDASARPAARRDSARAEGLAARPRPFTRAWSCSCASSSCGDLMEACSIYARTPGLVVYEDHLSASPRRKVRVGDRVTSSQGIVTIPEVGRMIVDASVDESQVHRIRPGQKASVRVEAYPDLRLTGHVARVGTLASSSVYRPLDAKVFDLIIELDPTRRAICGRR